MTLFLYPETQYSQSVVFSIEENVAQLNRKKKFIFHKTNFKIFCILSTDLDFHFRLSGKAGKESWVQVTAIQPGSSFGFNFGRNNYCWLLKFHANVVYVQFQAFVAIFDTKC